ncbi:MAG: hypothetical protein ACUZ8H_05675 [Candidatus Anammoxibacter sp.]
MLQNIFNKHSFAVLIGISAIIHFGFIVSSSKIRDLIKSSIGGHTAMDSLAETTIEFILNDGTDDKDYPVKDEPLDIIDKIAEIDTESEKKKRQLFVDSSHLQTEEESLVETENIGEKGSIARDKKNNDSNLTEESFSDGESAMLSIPKGAYAFVQGDNSSYQPESILTEEDVVENASKQPLPPSKPKIEHEHELIDEEIDDENIFEEEKETLTHYADRNDIETTEASASKKEYEREELRITDREFERIIPIPLDMNPLNDKEQDGIKETEALENEIYKAKESENALADLPTREKKRIVREITELYYEENTDSNHEEHKQKTKVSMSVNGKSVYNVPAPSFKADSSNTALFGEPSFNIRKHEYAAYYKHIRDKISLYWLLYFGTDQSINFTTNDSRPVIVEFKIQPSGKITDVVISDDAGNSFLASRTQTSVANTQLDKFPSFIEEEFIDVKFNFFFF